MNINNNYYQYFDKYQIVEIEIYNEDLKTHYANFAHKHNQQTLATQAINVYLFPILCSENLTFETPENKLTSFNLKIKLTSIFYSKNNQKPNNGFVLNNFSQKNVKGIVRCGEELVQGLAFSTEENTIQLQKYEPIYFLELFYPTIVKIL